MTLVQKKIYARGILGLCLALLLVAPPSSAANRAISGSMPAFGDVADYELSPDDAWVVYRADQETDEANELYSVPSDGSAAPRRLSGLLPSGSRVAQFAITPDSQRVVYIAPQDSTGVNELYSVPIAGGAATKLNGSLVAGGDVSLSDFRISADSQRVVYRADQETDDVFELYSVPITGGPATKLNAPLVAGGDVFFFPIISADSQRVVYTADQETDDVFELYSVPLTGGPAAKLNSPLMAASDVSFFGFRISADSQRVVYYADQQTDGVFELYSVPIAGGTATKLNAPLVAGGNVFNFTISADSQRVVYRADQQTDQVRELYATDLGPRAVGFAAATTSVAENAGSTALPVALNAPVLAAVTVDYAVTGGSATNGSDYTLAAGQVVIPAGQTTASISVAIVDDALEEGDETVVITLSNPQEATLATPILTLTISDSDVTPLTKTVYLPLTVR